MSAPIQLDILVTKLDNDAVIPTYAKPGDAGADLYSISDLVLAPGERALVKTGIAIALPNGYVGLVHPRSGLGLKNGISVVNTPGTIDAGYRGEIGVVYRPSSASFLSTDESRKNARQDKSNRKRATLPR